MKQIANDIQEFHDITPDKVEKLKLEQVDEVFNTLEKEYDEAYIYNMEWLYENAHHQIDRLYAENIQQHLKQYCQCTGEECINCELEQNMEKTTEVMRGLVNNFKKVKRLTNVLEIAASFVVIMMIHILTDVFVENYSTIVSASLIVIFFALFKIFLEGAVVNKILYKREKILFKRNIEHTRDAFIRLYVFYLWVNDLAKEKMPDEQRHQKALSLIQETRNIRPHSMLKGNKLKTNYVLHKMVPR